MWHWEICLVVVWSWQQQSHFTTCILHVEHHCRITAGLFIGAGCQNNTSVSARLHACTLPSQDSDSPHGEDIQLVRKLPSNNNNNITHLHYTHFKNTRTHARTHAGRQAGRTRTPSGALHKLPEQQTVHKRLSHLPPTPSADPWTHLSLSASVCRRYR